jgi:hypothetical protein
MEQLRKLQEGPVQWSPRMEFFPSMWLQNLRKS